ncbi:hypothetical protein WA158_006841 [Blastocystis sp. Blastoise]
MQNSQRKKRNSVNSEIRNDELSNSKQKNVSESIKKNNIQQNKKSKELKTIVLPETSHSFYDLIVQYRRYIVFNAFIFFVLSNIMLYPMISKSLTPILIPFIFENDIEVRYLKKNILDCYPTSLFTELYMNNTQDKSMGPLFINHSAELFSYIDEYMSTKKIDVNTLNYSKRLQLYADLQFYKLPTPTNLIDFDIQTEIQRRWQLDIKQIEIGDGVYTIRKEDLKNRHLYYSIFSKEIPEDLRINLYTNHLQLINPYYYFNYINEYILKGYIYIKENDTQHVEAIRNEFYTFNIQFTDKMWNSIVRYNSIFPESTLITDEYSAYLSKWVGQDKRWKLLYRGSQDGYSSRSFHRHCDLKGETLTIVSSPIPDTNDVYILGAYVNRSWTSPTDGKSYKSVDPDSFIFTLKNPYNLPPSHYLCSGGARVLHHSVNRGPVLGGCYKTDNYSFYIGDSSNADKTCWIFIDRYDSFDIPSTIGSSLFVNTEKNYLPNPFSVKEIEVFGRQ